MSKSSVRSQNADLQLLELGIDVAGQEFIVVCPDANEPVLKAASHIYRFTDLSNASDIPEELHVDTGIIIGQVETMPRPAASHLLARLRDMHCQRVVLFLDDSAWSREDLLALGYLPSESTESDGHCYIYDSATFNEPREWNNASKWANPENFDRYRW